MKALKGWVRVRVETWQIDSDRDEATSEVRHLVQRAQNEVRQTLR